MNKKNATWSLVLLVLVFVGLAAYAVQEYKSSPAPAPVAPLASSTDVTRPVVQNPVGNVSLRLGMQANFGSLSIVPLKVVEDSRCATGNTCVQVGTVRISLRISAVTTTNIVQIALNRSAILGGYKVIFLDAAPYPRVGGTIAPNDYIFTFNVAPYVPPVNVSSHSAAATCYVGGCSREICSSDPSTVSSCVYMSAYACYKTAACEVQSNGQCGWTQTPELQMCLTNASSSGPSIQ